MRVRVSEWLLSMFRYLRLKYPTVVDMALAASAPIKLDSVGLVDPLKYYRIVTDAAEKIMPGCTAAVRRAFAALRAASPSEAQEALGLCQAPTVSEFGWNDLEFWITQYFATVSLYDARRPLIDALCTDTVALLVPFRWRCSTVSHSQLLYPRIPSMPCALTRLLCCCGHRPTQRFAAPSRLFPRDRQLIDVSRGA